MSPGRHADGDDGSVARDAGAAGAKGLGLIAVAVLLGAALLNVADRTPVATVATRVETTTTSTTERKGTGVVPPIAVTTTTAPLRDVKTIKVLTANGSGLPGAGQRIADELKAKGYDVLAPANAPTSKATMIYVVKPGLEREASVMASDLALPPTSVTALPNPPPVPAAVTANADLLVIVGSDLAGRPSGSTTSTAAPRATTATTVRSSTSTTPAKTSSTTTATTAKPAASTTTTAKP